MRVGKETEDMVMESGFSMIIANFRREKLEEVEKKLERLGSSAST